MMQFSLRFWSWYLHQPQKYYSDSLSIIQLNSYKNIKVFFKRFGNDQVFLIKK